MEIGEGSSAQSVGSAGETDPPPAGKIRLWIVDPRYIPIEAAEPLDYEVLDGGGQTIASGTLEGSGYIDIDQRDGEVSVRLAGEILTVHLGRQ